MYVCVYVCVCMCVCICVYVCMYMCVCMYAYLRLCMYAYLHLCMYVCTYALMYVREYVCRYKSFEVLKEAVPWSRILLQQLTVPECVTKFPSFYGTRSLLTAITTAHHLSVSWVRSTQSKPQSCLLNTHLNTSLSSKPVSSKLPLVRFHHQKKYITLLSLYMLHDPPISLSFIWSHQQYLVGSTDHETARYVHCIPIFMYDPTLSCCLHLFW